MTRDRLRTLFGIALFILPAVVLVMIFIYIFIGWDAWASLTTWKGLNVELKFMGLVNYKELFTVDAIFHRSLINTLILAVLFVGITIPLGMLIAILLDLGAKGRNIFRTIYLLPLSFSFVVSATIWMWMFAPNNGTINTVLRLLGLGFLAQPWITSTRQSLISVVIVYVWQFSGFATLVYYAGISSVSPELVEAAAIDGATLAQKYWLVVIPLQKPATLTVFTILCVYAWRVFDLVYLMTGGGPGVSSEVMATYLYRTTFNANRFAYGSAIGFFMFVISILIIVPMFILILRRQSEI
jgi:glucose/mannose transport system permease protein